MSREPWKKANQALLDRIMDAQFGAIHTKEKTTFSVFATDAERVKVEIFDTLEDDNPLIIDLMGEAPIYTLEITGNLAGKYYQYRVRRDGAWHLVQDPWAYSMTANSEKAMIVDFDEARPWGWEGHLRPESRHKIESIIYETHMRDMTVSKASNHKAPGTYIGMVERGTENQNGDATGLDHLIEMGITHIHLLPLHDMGSVDEIKGGYNWGYDPMYFFVPEGSYASDPVDGKVRVIEMRQMIQGFHEAGIKVVLDVVYNHTYVQETHPFEILAPGWYFRKDKVGAFGNGSGCGNETASESPIFRKYLLDSLTHYLKAYQIDGFRFDLMALHDDTLVHEIEECVVKLAPDAILYGEPWTGGKSLLPKAKQFRQGKQKGMAISLFNDHVRNAIKGDNDGDKKGFVSGGSRLEKEVAKGIVGGISYNEEIEDYTQNPGEAINYVSCHDNLCLYDKLKRVHPNASEETLVKIHLMAISIPLLSFGIPFIQGGTEILRTKNGDHNSFISGDEVNAVDWKRKTQFRGHFEGVKALIALRKSLSCFKQDDPAWIREHVSFEILSKNVIAYQIHFDRQESIGEMLLIVHNASQKPYSIMHNSGTILYDSEFYVSPHRVAREIESEFQVMPQNTVVIRINH